MRTSNLFASLLIGSSLLFTAAPASAASVCAKVMIDKREVTLEAQARDMKDRFAALAERFPGQVKIVSKVKTGFREPKAGANFNSETDILVLSVKGLDYQKQAELKKAVMEAMGGDSLSFNLKEGETHLYTRFGDSLVDYDYRWSHRANGNKPEGWDIFLFRNGYNPVQKAAQYGPVLEPVISFTPLEMERVNQYITNAEKDPVKTVGRFNMDGVVFNSRNLESNVPPQGSGNNCTSWLMNAPVMMDGSTLLNGLGPASPYRGYIATNPGWLLGYLLNNADARRVPMNLLWTNLSAEDQAARLQQGGLLNWNFDPH